MAKRFQKRSETFQCLNCGASVVGLGYTNHCPQCLWSQHVDINPGDRAEPCRGAMAPVAIELKGDQKIILHRCGACGMVRRNKAAEDDNFEEILKIMRGK